MPVTPQNMYGIKILVGPFLWTRYLLTYYAQIEVSQQRAAHEINTSKHKKIIKP